MVEPALQDSLTGRRRPHVRPLYVSRNYLLFPEDGWYVQVTNTERVGIQSPSNRRMQRYWRERRGPGMVDNRLDRFEPVQFLGAHTRVT